MPREQQTSGAPSPTPTILERLERLEQKIEQHMAQASQHDKWLQVCVYEIAARVGVELPPHPVGRIDWERALDEYEADEPCDRST